MDSAPDDVDAAIVHLQRWASAAKVEDAADRRVRKKWAQQQAEDEATLVSLLFDLAEQETPVALHSNGGTVRGAIAQIGADYVAIVHGPQLTLLPLAAVAWIRPEGAAKPATFGDRTGTSGRLVGVLAGLADERTTARLVAGGDTLVGEVAAVGEDVVTLRPTGAHPGDVVYVPVASLTEVSLRLSG